MNINIEQERMEFEAWQSTGDADLSRSRVDSPSYEDEITNCEWYSWLAAKRSAQASQWQPIETAPKDGSQILLGRAESEELDCDAICTPGRWDEGCDDGVDYMGNDSGFRDDECQIFCAGRSFGAESHRYAPNQPTHWMPLPKGPL